MMDIALKKKMSDIIIAIIPSFQIRILGPKDMQVVSGTVEI